MGARNCGFPALEDGLGPDPKLRPTRRTRCVPVRVRCPETRFPLFGSRLCCPREVLRKPVPTFRLASLLSAQGVPKPGPHFSARALGSGDERPLNP